MKRFLTAFLLVLVSCGLAFARPQGNPFRIEDDCAGVIQLHALCFDKTEQAWYVGDGASAVAVPPGSGALSAADIVALFGGGTCSGFLLSSGLCDSTTYGTAANLSALTTASGIAAGAEHMGTFTGDLFADSQTIKQLFQAAEKELERLSIPAAAGSMELLAIDSDQQVQKVTELTFTGDPKYIWVGKSLPETSLGGAATEYTVSVPVAGVQRITWTGTGPNPNLTCDNFPARRQMEFWPQNGSEANKGRLVVSNCSTGGTWVDVLNGAAVAETFTQGAGTLRYNVMVLTPLDSDLTATSSDDDEAPSSKATKTYADTKIPKTQNFTECFTIKNPTANSDHHVFRAKYGLTVTGMHCLAEGGTSLTGQFQEADANGANGADIDSDMTCTAGTNVNDDGALSNASVDAGDWVNWKTTSVSGTQTEVAVCFDYTVP